jgi:hypothetical protein
MTSIRMACPNCCPDGGAIFARTWDDDMRPVWECQNCWYQKPRRVSKRPSANSPLTPSQVKAITQIQQYKLRGEISKSFGREYMEVKQFSVQNLGHVVSVVVEVGNKGDEGTMGAIYCRSRGHFFVGRNGKISIAGKEGRKQNRYPLIYGWRS